LNSFIFFSRPFTRRASAGPRLIPYGKGIYVLDRTLVILVTERPDYLTNVPMRRYLRGHADVHR
jgi:hypothetical protein